MASRIEVVSNVSFQRPSQMPLSKQDHMIQALSANTSDKAFREWILPRTPGRGEHFLNTHSLNPSSKLATVHSVTVSQQISRRSIFGERLDDLLCRPFCRGMLGHVEMQHAATLMRQHHEYEQDFQL